MIIDMLNNTSRIPVFQSQQPQAYLRSKGLMGVGQTAPSSTDFSWQEIQSALNAQLLFFTNLDRAKEGLAPLGEQYNPTINVAPSPEAKNIAGIAIAAIVGGFALVALSKK